MPIGRDYDAHSVASLSKFGYGIKYLAAEFIGYFPGSVHIGVAYADELGCFKFGIYAGMVLPEVPYADNPALQFFSVIHRKPQ